MNISERRILIAVDNPETAMLQRALLKDVAERIECVSTVAAALNQLNTQKYSIVVTDYAFPDGNGMLIVQAGAEQRPKVPVIVATKLSHGRVATEAIQFGAADFQTKGANNWDDLLRSVQRIIRYSEMEKELLSSLELQAAILNAVPCNIALLGTAGEIIKVNNAWKDFAFVARVESEQFGIGKNYFEVIKHQADKSVDLHQVQRGIDAVLRGELEDFTFEYPIHRAGTTQWFRMTIAPFKQGAVRGAVVMQLNVTETKLAEANLRKAEEELKQLKKLESSRQNEQSGASDFNRQLLNTLGYADLLRTSVKESLLQHYADSVYASIKNILASSRKDRSEFPTA